MNATNSSETVTETEVFYRGMALIGLLSGGFPNNEELPEVAKSLARRMMEDSTEEGGLAAIKPKRTRK